MPRTVVLRHELPDRSWHYDWMVERASPEERRLVSFRVDVRADDPNLRHFRAERLGEHRVAYLEFEGELSGGRGWVRRVARGVVLGLRNEPGAFEVELDFGRGDRRWIGRPARRGGTIEGSWWEFELLG